MKKVLGILLMILGLFGLLLLMIDFNLVILITSPVVIVGGWKMFKQKKVKKEVFTPPVSPQTLYKNKMDFNVVGISKTNDKGKDIQSLIGDYVEEQIQAEYIDAYDGMTNKEIIEDGDRIFEADLSGSFEIKLVPEPENPYDPNAIKVVHNEMGHIGYVPAHTTDKVKDATKGPHRLEWQLLGGKFKYADEDDKIVKETLNYGMNILIKY